MDLLLVNETEAAALAEGRAPEESVARLRAEFPALEVILTLGAEGALWARPGGVDRVPAPRVQAVDTTAAGDTFTGYVLAALMEGEPPASALAWACRAAALSVTRPGAASSIPRRAELAALVSTAALAVGAPPQPVPREIP